MKTIKTALISVYHKDGLDIIVKLLASLGVKIYSTGGTYSYIKNLGILVTEVSDITKFPEIFGGRVKTLHPAIAGGILKIRGNEEHEKEAEENNISEIDLVIVDLYPFEETLMSGADEKAIIEKIDIGGPTMIRAAAKNFESVAIVASKKQYGYITEILKNGNQTTLEQRKYLAGQAFATTLAYEMPIAGYFGTALRYGENPHQNGAFIGEMSEVFEFMQGKELSYNNLLDTEAAIKLMKDFSIPCFAILKHTNACGCATGNENTLELFKKAYMADTKSAFGGILITNQEVDGNVALYIIEELKLFIEVIIAPSFTKEALEILKRKPNVRVLKLKDFSLPTKEVRTSLTGFLVQDRDNNVEGNDDFETTTLRSPTSKELSDLVIGSIIAKHLKSNCVALVKDGMLLAMGSGQVSRVDALKSALAKAKNFKLDVAGGILASEAFFPFPDCVEIAGAAGITAVVHPGGSKDDKASIDMANKIGMAMVTTGIRHFKH